MTMLAITWAAHASAASGVTRPLRPATCAGLPGDHRHAQTHLHWHSRRPLSSPRRWRRQRPPRRRDARLPPRRPAAARAEAGRPFFTCFGPRSTARPARTGPSPRTTGGDIRRQQHRRSSSTTAPRGACIDTAVKSVVRSIAKDDARAPVRRQHRRVRVPGAGRGRRSSTTCRCCSTSNAEDRAFNDVWTAHVTPQGVYFQSREVLFRLTPAAVPTARDGWTGAHRGGRRAGSCTGS